MNLDDAKSRFADLAERLPHLVWLAKADGSHDYFNSQWYEFTGLSPSQSVGSLWRAAIHPDDLARVEARFAKAVASGELYEAEYRLRSAAGHYCWILSRARPEQDDAGNVSRWFGTCTMIDRQKKAEEAQRLLDEQYRLALDAAKLGTWRIDLESGTISWDAGCCALFDMPSDAPRSMALEDALERIHPDDRDHVRAKLTAALLPDSDGSYEVECRTILSDGSIRWTQSNGRVFLTDDDDDAPRIAGLSGVIGDITEKRTAAEAQELLTRELTHRVKNLFAIANGMVSLTARATTDTKEMATALRGRLGALSRAHELVQPMTTHPQSGIHVSLHELIAAVIAPYTHEDETRLRAEGPEVGIGANTTTSLALVLHELATNAAKYGCLSTDKGRLTIAWEITGHAVNLVWTEAGGPAVKGEPDFAGFGSQLAQRSVAGQLGGVIERDWRPDGLCVRMTLPLDRLTF